MKTIQMNCEVARKLGTNMAVEGWSVDDVNNYLESTGYSRTGKTAEAVFYGFDGQMARN